MKKQILKLGKALNKADQKLIHGGGGNCYLHSDCDPAERCTSYYSGGVLFSGVCEWIELP